MAWESTVEEAQFIRWRTRVKHWRAKNNYTVSVAPHPPNLTYVELRREIARLRGEVAMSLGDIKRALETQTPPRSPQAKPQNSPGQVIETATDKVLSDISMIMGGRAINDVEKFEAVEKFAEAAAEESDHHSNTQTNFSLPEESW